MTYLFPHQLSCVFFWKLITSVFRKLPSYRFWISAKTMTRNSEFPSKNLSFEFKIYLPYISHNLLNGDNLQVDSPIIRKILSYPFYVWCKNTINSELGIFNDVLGMSKCPKMTEMFNPKQAGGGGGGIRPKAGSSLCYAETVSNRKLKLCDFYCILIGLNSEYKPVPWNIHCCHGNAIVEGCSVKFWLKLVENCNFWLKSFSNRNLGLPFVISISKLPPIPNFKQIRLKTKKLRFSTFLPEQSLKYKTTS